MSSGRLFGMVMKYAPKIGRAFGQLSEGSKKFGTLVQADVHIQGKMSH